MIQGNNIVKVVQDLTTKGKKVTKMVKMSDALYQRFHGINEQFQNIEACGMQIRMKQLDNPIPWYKKILAGIAKIKTKHEFLIFEGEEILMSIDYYEDNRIVIKIGDINTVLSGSQQREKSIISKEGPLEWSVYFKANQRITFGNILNMVMKYKVQDFSQAFYNGSHFSRDIWSLIKN